MQTIWSNPEYRKKYMKAWYLKNKVKCNLQSSTWQKNNKKRHVEIVRKSKFGLTAEQQQQILSGLCEICGIKNATHIDHDHISGIVRGGLCNNCNTGLGMFSDNISSLVKAISYLKGEEDVDSMASNS